MYVIGSLGKVDTPDSFGDVGFVLHLSNKGTEAYDCTMLRATSITTNGATHRVPAQDPYQCTAPGHTIAPGSEATVLFFVPGNSHTVKDIVVLPYGSNTSRMVWRLAG